MDKRLKALIVEDSEEDALLVARELKRSGYDLAYERVDAPDAFAAALESGQWDVVLCDYTMPRFSGPAALELLRGKGLDIPFILVSGSIGEEAAVACMKAGAHDYIMKDRLSRLAPAIDREIAEAAVRAGRRRAEAELIKINRLYALLRSVNQLIVRVRDRRTLFGEACRIAVEHGLFRLAWVGLADEDTGTVRPVASAGCDEGYLESIHISLSGGPEGMGPTGRAVREGVHYINNDTAGNPAMSPWREAALARGFLSSAAFPLVMDGKAIGAFNVYASEAGFFDEGEASLLDELAGDLSFALLSMEQEEKRSGLEAAIKRGKEEWERTFDAITDPIMLLGTDYTIKRVNKTMADKLGVSPKEAVGLTCHKAVHGLDAPHPDCPHNLLLADGRTHSVEIFEERIGGYFMVSDSPLFDAEGRLYGSVHYARDITERKQAEEKLRGSEASLKEAQRVARVGNWELDLTGNQLTWSDEIYRIFEVDSTDFGATYEAFIDAIHPDDRGYVNDAYTASLMDRTPYDIVHRLLMKDGRVKYVNERCETHYGPDGRPARSVGTVQDITERKLAEEAVRDSEEMLRSITCSAQDAIVMIGEDGCISYWNRAAERILGYTSDEAIGREMHPLIAPARYHDAYRDGMRHFVESGEGNAIGKVLEMSAVRKDGTEIPVELSVASVRLRGKWNAVGVLRDITERKRAEEKLRLANALVENSTTMLFRWKAEEGWPVEYVSNNVSQFGYTPEELLSGQVAYASIVHPDDLERVAAEVARYTADGAERFTQEYRVVTKGGDVRWLDDRTVVERDAAGAVTHYQGIVIDITDRKLADEALKREKEFSDSAIDSLPGIFYLFDDQMKFIRWNKNLETVAGYSADALSSMQPLDFFPDEDKERVGRKIEEAMESGKAVTEAEIVSADGTRAPYMLTASRIPLDGKDCFLGTGVDITERKLAEVALTDSERRLRVILDAAFDGILVADAQTRVFTLGNRAICDMLGYSQEKLLTLRVDDIHPHESLPEVMRQFERQLKGEVKVAADLPVKPREGPVFYADISASTTEIAGRTSMVGVFHDVTERRMAEAALKNEAAVTGALLEAARAAGGNLDWDDVAGNMAGLLLRFSGGNGVFIFTLARDGMLIPRKAAGLPEANLAPFYSLRVMATEIELFSKTLSAKKTLRFDSDSLPMYIDAAYAGPLRLKEAVVTPIPVRDGVAGFILTNYDSLPDDPRVAEIVEGMARQLGVAHENSRLYAETRNKGIELARSVETLKVLSEIDKRILSTLDRDEMMTGALSQIRRVAPADVACVLLAEEDAGVLRFSYGWSLGMNIGDTVPFDHCAGYQALMAGRTLARMDLAEEPDPSVMDRFFLDGGIKSDIFVPIICKENRFGLLHVGSYRVAGFSTEDVETIENLARQMGIALENTRLISDVEEMFIGVVTAMASAIDAKSPWTKGHSERVTNYAMMTAARMGIGQKDMDALRLGGLLHDIGKIGTYDQVLDKPGKLTDEEFAMIKRHPDAGANILGPIKQFKDMLPIIRHHHERWDGKGYPAGLAGEDIPLLARILCVADSFDSMTADRPYRKSLGFEFAAEEITRCAGSQFDPEVAKAFVGMLEETG